MSDFLEIKGPDDEAGLSRLLEVSRQDQSDMGRVLATFRAWPGPFFWLPYGLLWLATVALTVTAPNGHEAALRGGILAGNLVLWGGVLLAAYGLERHRVCEHGLVLGFRKRSDYVIPWATVDPGRIRVGKRMGLLGRRPELPQTSPRYRVGVFALDGVVVNGLDSAVRSSWSALDPDPVRTPFAWWLLATRRAPDLLAAIERAMVADGYPAGGLAARARAQAFTVGWTPAARSPIPPRLGTDPVIGVQGPLVG